MATSVCVNEGSGNGLLPDDIKSLSEPVLTSHQYVPELFILNSLRLNDTNTHP